jgi:hypothetical protein
VVTAPGVERTGVPTGVSLADEDQTDEYGALELEGKTLLGPAGKDGELAAAGVVLVTGQTVVEIAMVEVTTVVESAGQLVTVGAQLVIVISLVV